MITNVEFSEESAVPGDRRVLKAWADSPMMVSVECFRQPPSPPTPGPCPECGEFPIGNGDPVEVLISPRFFREKEGFVRVTVRDRAGDERVFELAVARVTEDRDELHYA